MGLSLSGGHDCLSACVKYPGSLVVIGLLQRSLPCIVAGKQPCNPLSWDGGHCHVAAVTLNENTGVYVRP